MTDAASGQEVRARHAYPNNSSASHYAASAHVSEVTGEGFAPNLVINNAHDMRHLQQLVLGGWAEREWGVPGVRVEVPA